MHVLVNNAVVNRRMRILEMDRDTWDWIMRIDLRLPYFLSQATARRMIEQGEGGSIVSISSLNALYALEQISVYGPAKAGLSQLTKVMALEWAEHGIRANAIAPGFMDTPLAAPDLGGRRHAPLDPQPRSDRAAGAPTGARRRLPPARLRRRLVPERADVARRRRRECGRALVSPNQIGRPVGSHSIHPQEEASMKIAVVGAGAMGSILGARFARGGHDTVLVDVVASRSSRRSTRKA